MLSGTMRPIVHPRIVACLAVAALLPAFAAREPAVPAAGLFDSDGVLELTLTGDLKPLMDDRDSLKATYHPVKLTYVDASGAPASLDIEAKTRGHWRRQKPNCDFPPLRLDFPKEQPEGSLFAGQDKLKLVTHCRKSGDFEQYVLREYLVYKLYNLFTPLSFRARLVRATYVDTAGRLDTLTRYALLLEAEEEMAKRNGGTIFDARGATFGDFDPHEIARLSAFEYLIGGTDWSLAGLHNIVMVRTEAGDIHVVPYDFDWTGLVDTRYAFPDSRLAIRTVRQRLYRGVCRTAEEWGPIVAEFAARKDSLYAIYRGMAGLDPKYVERTAKYLDEFYQVITKPGDLRREFIQTCLQSN